MNEKELYQKKFQAQLDEKKADIAKLKARASGAKADAQIEMNKILKELDQKLGEAGKKLSELNSSSEDAWVSLKKGMENTWGSVVTTYNDVASKF